MRCAFVFLMVLVLAVPVMGQEEDATCEPEAFQAMFVEAVEGIDVGAEDYFAAVAEVQSEIAAKQAGCMGLAFSSDSDGMQPVLGPLTVPSGTYRVRLETSGYAIAEVTEVEGSCETSSFGSMFNVMGGQAEGGAETILTSEDCVMLLQLSNTSEAWTMTFEALALD